MNHLAANQPALPTNHLQLILGKALTDRRYRELLYLDPGKALEGYVLTDQEVQAVHGLSRQNLEGLANELQARLLQADTDLDQARRGDDKPGI